MILDEARKSASQRNMIDICEKWLKTYQENQAKQLEAQASASTSNSAKGKGKKVKR